MHRMNLSQKKIAFHITGAMLLQKDCVILHNLLESSFSIHYDVATSKKK